MRFKKFTMNRKRIVLIDIPEIELIEEINLPIKKKLIKAKDEIFKEDNT
jgi:hypothetical protein